MLFSLWLFAATLVRVGLVHNVNAVDLTIAAHSVALDMKPLYRGKDGRERTAKLIMVMAGGESAGNPLVIGDSGDAHGLMQIHPDVWGDFLSENGFDYTSNFDTVQSARSMVTILVYLKKHCKDDLRAALYAYASGHCEGTEKARRLIDSRCALAGGCD